MKKNIIKNFNIPDPVYNKPVMVMYGCSNDEFHTFLEQEHKNVTMPREGQQIAKYVFIKTGNWYTSYVWMEHADPLDPYDIGSLSHELAHHTFFVLNSSGVEVIPGKSEEAFTYYHTYLLEQALMHLNRDKRVQRAKQKKVSGGGSH